MKKTLSLIFSFLIAVGTANASTVGGTITNSSGTVQGNGIVVFTITGCSVNQMTGPSYPVVGSYTFTANSSGVWSGSVVGNDLITCPGSGSTQWKVSQFSASGNLIKSAMYSLQDAVAFNPATATPSVKSEQAYLTNPIVSQGDLIVGGLLGVPARVPIGTNGTQLMSNGNTVYWGVGTSGVASYPAPGIPISTGSGWSSSYPVPAGLFVGTTDTQTLTNKTIDGAGPTAISYTAGLTSDAQAQLNSRLQTTPVGSQQVNMPNDTQTCFGTLTGSVCNGTSLYKDSVFNASGITQNGATYPGNLLGGTTFFANTGTQPLTNATSSANINSPAWDLSAYYWNGSSSTNDTFLWQNVMGSGSNPTATLTLTHNGTTTSSQSLDLTGNYGSSPTNISTKLGYGSTINNVSAVAKGICLSDGSSSTGTGTCGGASSGPTYHIAAYNAAINGNTATLSSFNGTTDSTGNTFQVPILGGHYHAAQYANANNNTQGIAAAMADPGCASGCTIESDVNDPANDRLGYFNGYPEYNWPSWPKGVIYEDFRNGAHTEMSRDGNSIDGTQAAWGRVCFLSSFTSGYCSNDLSFNMMAGWNYEAGTGSTSGSSVFTLHQETAYSSAAGNNTMRNLNGWTLGQGDHNIDSLYWTERQATTQGDSEGFVFHQDNVTEGAGPQGTIATGGTGANTVTINCSTDCQLVGNGTTLLDLTTGSSSDSAATATTVSVGGSATKNVVTFSTLTVPASVSCTTAANINPAIDHGDGSTNNGVSTTFGLNCSRALTSSDVGSLVNLTAPFIENVKITAVGPYTAGQPQNVTAVLRYAHSGPSSACVGGAVGQYLVVDSLNQSYSTNSGTHMFMYPQWVLCSTTNTVDVATQANGDQRGMVLGGYGSTNSSGPVGLVHLYHGAEIADSVNPVTHQIDFGYAHIGDSDAAWAPGDQVIDASLPYGWWKLSKYSLNVQDPRADVEVNKWGFMGAAMSNATIFSINPDRQMGTLFGITTGVDTVYNAQNVPSTGLFEFGNGGSQTTPQNFDIINVYHSGGLQFDMTDSRFNILGGFGLKGYAADFQNITVGYAADPACANQNCQLLATNNFNGSGAYAGVFKQTSNYGYAAMFLESSNGGSSQIPILAFGNGNNSNPNAEEYVIGLNYDYGTSDGSGPVDAISIASGAPGSWLQYMECWNPTTKTDPTCRFNTLLATNASFTNLSTTTFNAPTIQANNQVIIGGSANGNSSNLILENQNTTATIQFNYDGDFVYTANQINSGPDKLESNPGDVAGQLSFQTMGSYVNRDLVTRLRISGAGGSGCVTMLMGDDACDDNQVSIGSGVGFATNSAYTFSINGVTGAADLAPASTMNGDPLCSTATKCAAASIPVTSYTAAISPTTLYTVPSSPSAGSFYCASSNIVTTVGGTATGGLNNYISYTQPDGSAVTMQLGGSVDLGTVGSSSANNGNTPNQPFCFIAKPGSVIQYSTAFPSGSASGYTYVGAWTLNSM
jgi:hypothetical protein